MTFEELDAELNRMLQNAGITDDKQREGLVDAVELICAQNADVLYERLVQTPPRNK